MALIKDDRRLRLVERCLTRDEDRRQLRVRVLPNSARNEIVGPIEGALKVKITAKAIQGKANDQLIKFLAKELGLPKSSIKLVKGIRSRDKLLTFDIWH